MPRNTVRNQNPTLNGSAKKPRNRAAVEEALEQATEPKVEQTTLVTTPEAPAEPKPPVPAPASPPVVPPTLPPAPPTPKEPEATTERQHEPTHEPTSPANSTGSAVISVSPNQTLVTTEPEPEGLTAAKVVAEARASMRQDMSTRLGGMMESLRSGLRAELTEMASDLREACLLDLAARFTAINLTLEKAVSPIIKPSVRSKLRELKQILVGQFLQMLREEGRKDDIQTLQAEATKTADEVVKELVPNLGKLS